MATLTKQKVISAKRRVSKLMKGLTDNCSLEDIQYHLYVIQKIERGLKEVEAGRVYSHEEVKRKLSKWLCK